MHSIDSAASALVKKLIATIQDLTRGMYDGHEIDAIVLDFAKTFYKVPDQRLLYKLHHHEIHGSTLSWIESFLTSWKQHVFTVGGISLESPKEQSWDCFYSWLSLTTSQMPSVLR
jgi:hypothetical protein